MSTQYMLAVSLADGACLPPQFTEEKLHDPGILALADRIRTVQDPEIETEYPGKFSAIVDIALVDGRHLSMKVDNPRWSSAIPLGTTEVRQKFMALCEGVNPRDRLEAIADRVERVQSLASVRELTELLGR